jgi:uncharacterized repeat protein (TIGR03806 family)
LIRYLLVSAVLLFVVSVAHAKEPASPASSPTATSASASISPSHKPFETQKRTPWNTSRVVGSPDPPPPYVLRRAFPNLKFDEPLELQIAPGGKFWIVAERKGKIYTFADDPATDKKHLLLDVGHTVYGVVLHPKFAENGYLYVAEVPDLSQPYLADGSRVARYKLTQFDPPVADPKSQTIILKWPSGGHNGGCLRFGPDGYLYLATGDGSGIADQWETGQDLSDLLGAILRIDVDRPSRDGAAGDRPYSIPPDNPFVGRDGAVGPRRDGGKQLGARPENYAYGLRQAWKFNFDPATGDLWAGEVGQDLWDMVLKIEKGGNYGWSIVEGTHPFRPQRKPGPTPILPPVIEHPHSEYRSITGGYVYRGSRLPELRGTYIYGDYDTGRVAALRYDATQPPKQRLTEQRELADTQLRIVAFGENQAGEIYALDFIDGTLHELAPAPPQTAAAPSGSAATTPGNAAPSGSAATTPGNTAPSGSAATTPGNAAPSGSAATTPGNAVPPFPRKLSETGLFASTKDLIPADGLIPYSVNAELWSDGASKQRFLAVPGDGRIEFETVTYPQPAPGSEPGWRFPDGTVLVKTFFLDGVQAAGSGTPARRRLETRLLHVERVHGSEEVGDQVWRGYTYVWNDDQTDAELCDKNGLDREFTIADAEAPGGTRTQKWHFPSRTECNVCHTVTAKYALGVNTAQLNREHDYGATSDNQLAVLDRLGLFTNPLTKSPSAMTRLADYHAPHESLDRRARAYLQANCSHCHRKWGGGNAEFQLLHTLPLSEMGAVDTVPGQGTFGLPNPKILVPGDAARSLVLFRMERLGLGRMPHIASNVVDREGTKLIRAWIESLK